MKTRMNYSNNQKPNFRKSFKQGWYNAQVSLELNMKKSGLALGVSIESPEGINWEPMPIKRP
jgi:flagellar motor switch protein FliM